MATQPSIIADYQLLAAMGFLLDYLRTPPPVEAAPLDIIPLGALPPKLPPLIVRLPQPGPEPLNMSGEPQGDKPVDQRPEIPFNQRWPDWTFVNPTDATKATTQGAAISAAGHAFGTIPRGARATWSRERTAQYCRSHRYSRKTK